MVRAVDMLTYLKIPSDAISVFGSQNIWRFIDSDVKHSYDDILAMDKQIRKIIGRLPKVDAEGNVLGSGTKRKNALAQSVS